MTTPSSGHDANYSPIGSGKRRKRRESHHGERGNGEHEDPPNRESSRRHGSDGDAGPSYSSDRPSKRRQSGAQRDDSVPDECRRRYKTPATSNLSTPTGASPHGEPGGSVLGSPTYENAARALRSMRHWPVDAALDENVTGDRVKVKWGVTHGVPGHLIRCETKGRKRPYIVFEERAYYIASQSRAEVRADGRAYWTVHWENEDIARDQLDRMQRHLTCSPSGLGPTNSDVDPPSSPSPQRQTEQGLPASPQALSPAVPAEPTVRQPGTSGASSWLDNDSQPHIVRPDSLRFKPMYWLVEYDIHELIRDALHNGPGLVGNHGVPREIVARWVRLEEQRKRPLMFTEAFVRRNKNFSGYDPRRAEAALVHCLGVEMEEACTACGKGGGTFAGCVVIDEFGGGECTSCKFSGKSQRCSFNKYCKDPSIKRAAVPVEDDDQPDRCSGGRSVVANAAKRPRGKARASSPVRMSQARDFVTSPANARTPAGGYAAMMSGGLGPRDLDEHSVHSAASHDVPDAPRSSHGHPPSPASSEAHRSHQRSNSDRLQSKAKHRRRAKVIDLSSSPPMATPTSMPAQQRSSVPRSSVLGNRDPSRETQPVTVYRGTIFAEGEMSDGQFEYVASICHPTKRKLLLDHWSHGKKRCIGREVYSEAEFYKREGWQFMTTKVMPYIFLPSPPEVIILDCERRRWDGMLEFATMHAAGG